MSRTIITELKERWWDAGFQKYLKNTGWAFFGKFVSLIISFFAGIYVIRHLGPANYGLLSFSVSFVALFSFIASLGVDSVLYRELAKDISRRNELLGTALLLKVVASLAAMLAIFGGAYLLAVDALTKLLIFINSFTLLFSSFTVVGYYFQAKVQAKYQAIPLICVTLIMSLLKVGVIALNKGIIYFACVLAFEYVLYMLFNLYYYSRFGNSVFAFRFKKDVAISLLRDSWPLMLSSAFIIVYTRIDQVMLKFITNDFNVGIYDAAVRLSEVWYFIPALIIGSVFPAVINARKISESLFQARIVKLYSLLFYLSLCAAIPVSIFSHFIIRLVYGEGFMEAAGVLSVYVWAGVPVFLSMVLNTYLLAENKNIISFTGAAIGMVANVLLNLTFIPLYGVYGAAIATLISYTLVIGAALLFKGSREQIFFMKEGIVHPVRWILKRL